MDDAGTAADTVQPVAVPLTLAGSSPDARRLLLVDDQGSEYTLVITPDLRAAVRAETTREPTRVGQLETKMSSSIRPREIQTRIRAGESTEAVAEAAGTTVDAIMPYVAPVLAEREHVAERALKASLRRTPGEGTAAHTQSRVLGDAVAAHLRNTGADPAEVAWDAYRRETGRWVLTATYDAGTRSGTARFTYDAPGNYALSDNDDARWLVGDVLPEPVAPARDDLQEARERRLAVVPAEELPLGTLGDAPDELPFGDAFEAEASTGLVDIPAPRQHAAPSDAEAAEGAEAPEVLDEPIRATTDEEASAAAERERAKHRRPVQKKRGRASVPSWDEIMFGGGDQ
ncbi:MULTISPECIES: septation protein SepH [unclassified Nocardioides]|uniref:septation protein SepH n=1 Tax=unclassified Nocardioides TaxID=2615069 RepID=UPI000A685D96|nr:MULTISPECIES: septation protein SepH [unclassified Nocardioides]